MPSLTIVVRVYGVVVKHLLRGLADSGHKDDAPRGGTQSVARAEERSAPGALFGNDAVVAKDEVGDVFWFCPGLSVVVALTDIGANRIRRGGVPQARAAHKACNESVVVVAPGQSAVTEAVIDPCAQSDGVRLAPCVSAVGAAVANDVDVFRQVAFVEFALVGDRHNAAVFCRNHGRDAVVR